MLKQFHRITPTRVDGSKPYELVGVFLDCSCRYFVVAVDPGAVAIAQREDDRAIDTAHRLIDGVGIGPGTYRTRPRISGADREQRPYVLIVPDVDMAIDDHDGTLLENAEFREDVGELSPSEERGAGVLFTS